MCIYIYISHHLASSPEPPSLSSNKLDDGLKARLQAALRSYLTRFPPFCVPMSHPDPPLFPKICMRAKITGCNPHMRPHDCHVGATLGPHWGSITPDVMPCKLLRETLQGYYPCSFSQVCENNIHCRDVHMSDGCNSSAALEAAWREQS